MSWMFGLALLVMAPACTTPRIPVPMPPYDSCVHFELSDDGSWLLCIDPNPYLVVGSAVTFKNLSEDVWVGGIVNDDGSVGCQSFRGYPGDLIQITIVSPSGEVVTTCYDLTEGGPGEDPYCGEPPT